MELQRTTLVISVLLTISIITTPILATPSFAEAVAQQQQQTQVVHYSNSWAVEVQGGVEEADALAQKHGLINYGQIGNQRNYYLFMDGEELGEVTKDLSELMITKTGKLKAEQKVGSVTQQKIVGKVKKEYTPPSDPGWSKQWSLENTGQTRGPSGLDLNVEPAWMQGITGEGVIVGIVDDGMEWRHNDLRVNYVSIQDTSVRNKCE
jgi:furin